MLHMIYYRLLLFIVWFKEKEILVNTKLNPWGLSTDPGYNLGVQLPAFTASAATMCTSFV